ncbi:MAG: hypothetical protein LQ345_005595 [Seirophora villosa]|nr:MAG: hypothetical protein LQ345_005595 [Seirophora villosa]
MQPSCTLCRRRKVKCDRNIPCANCVRAHADCIPSSNPHTPRGRLGGRKRQANEKLLERISNLEGLVQKVSGQSEQRRTSAEHSHVPPPAFAPVQPSINDGANAESQAEHQPLDQHPAPYFQHYLASSFWTALSEEISGLRGVLSNDEDGIDVEQRHGPDHTHSPASTTDSDFLLSPATSASLETSLTPHQMFVFCNVYLHNVDPVFKVLHAPSLRKYMQEGSPTLDCSPGNRGLEALKMAICYAAAVSMTDAECRHRLGEARTMLVATYRAGTERALGRADFLNSMEISTLQALTIYLARPPLAFLRIMIVCL